MTTRASALLALTSAAVAGLALAHSAPNSFVKLRFDTNSVRAEVLVPQSELSVATAAERTTDSFARYLQRHLSAETARGLAWTVEVKSVRDTTYLEHDYLSAEVVFTPPPGSPVREFVLVDDAVTHEVRNHTVLVLAQDAGEPRVLGVLQYPARKLAVNH